MINLKERWGHRYKIQYDPSYYAVPASEHSKEDEVCLQEIPCKNGTIYPYSETKLAVSLINHPGIANKLSKMIGCELIGDGDLEHIITFDNHEFPKVARLVKPLSKNPISPELLEKKKKALEKARAARFKTS